VSIASGDEEEKPPAWDLTVDHEGVVVVPLVGPVSLVGLGLSDASRVIREASIRREIFRDPTVSVTFKERKVSRVTVDGAVKNPGSHELPAAASHLTAALAAAGGLTEEAGTVIEIRKPPQAMLGGAPGFMSASYREPTPPQDPSGVVRIDLASYSKDRPAAAGNHFLPDGAVVTVMPHPQRFVTVMGLTGNRVMELPVGRDTRLLDALAMAGGPQYSEWVMDRIKVIRKVPGGDQTVTIKASIRAAKKERTENILLAAGDIVSVEENVLTFTISTLGALLNVGRRALAVP
jgi:protein involved in polysaccharide export with SLBB domain